jgi:uncharacterized phiE125 gp8 family phage protein
MPVIASPMMTLDEAKSYLTMTSTDSDVKLQTFIAAASQMIYNKVGVVSGSPTVDEWHDGGSETIVLRNMGPIESVTTVIESYGTTVYTLTQVSLDTPAAGSAYQYTVDLDQGLLIRRAAGIAIPFAAGSRNIHVTYVAGYATVPADIKQAALVLLDHLWSTQRGPQSRAGVAPDGVGYSMPNRVLEILQPYMIAGIA